MMSRTEDLISFIVCPELKEMFLYKLTFTQWCTLNIALRMKVPRGARRVRGVHYVDTAKAGSIFKLELLTSP